jgi:hypothetical protein
MLVAGNTGLALVCECGILRAWAGKKIGTLSELDRRPATQQIEMRRKSDWADCSQHCSPAESTIADRANSHQRNWHTRTQRKLESEAIEPTVELEAIELTGADMSRLGLTARQSSGEHKSRPSELTTEKSGGEHEKRPNKSCRRADYEESVAATREQTWFLVENKPVSRAWRSTVDWEASHRPRKTEIWLASPSKEKSSDLGTHDKRHKMIDGCKRKSQARSRS